MNIGNFFDAISDPSKCTPVNPMEIQLTLICKGDMFPNGQPNPSGRAVRGRGVACLVAMDPRDIIRSRVRARKHLSLIVQTEVDIETKLPPPTSGNEEELAVVFEQIAIIVHQFDRVTKAAGDKLFPDSSVAMDFVTLDEANRVIKLYNEYMHAEHPEEVDQSTRNKSERAVPRPSPRQPK